MEFKVVHIEETDSTNRWLKDYSATQPVEDMVVCADYQTAGKGCGANTWESERGKNLTFSMLIHPKAIPANQQFHITEIVSVALCKTLQPYIYNKVEIKWPNDIYVDDKKICGILIENRLQGAEIKDCIIGIGLNVNQMVFKSDAPNLDCFDKECNNKTTCFEYRKMLFRKGKDSLYKDKITCFTARLMDVLPDGRLLLVDKEGLEHTYAFKEVQFII